MAEHWKSDQAFAMPPAGGIVEVTERWSAVVGREQFDQSSTLMHEVSFGMRPGGGAGGVRNGLARSGARIGRPYAGGAGVSASSRAPVVRPPPLGDDCGQWSAMGVPMHGHGPTYTVQENNPVVDFLERVGLEQYADILMNAGFDDMETLLEIEDADLKDIGIPRGHAVKLRKRLREFLEAGGERCVMRKQPAALTDEPHMGLAAEEERHSLHHALHAPQRQQPRQPRQPQRSSHRNTGSHLPPTVQRLGTAPVSPRCMEPTEKMKTSVEKSWEQLQGLGCEYLGELLYRDFFEQAPEAMDLFPPEVRAKYREWYDEGSDDEELLNSPALRKIWSKIFVAVGNTVAGLHDTEKLVPRLRELGGRHAGYGTQEKHLNLLSKSLIQVLKNCLGETFTPEVEFAWTMVYGFISAIMAGGMHAARMELASRSQPAHGPVAERMTSVVSTAGRNAKPQPQEPPARRQEITVGVEVEGGNEVYYIERHLQNAIFGDVFEATGLSSGRSYAVKVLDQDMISRFARLQQEDHQFCESPLCEIRFAELMRGLDNVVQLEDHFADRHFHYIVSELASHGDLLEALRLTPGGFEEEHGQLLMFGAARGLAQLHQRGLAMQDVSLENLLLHVYEDGQWQVRICDPGQAVTFTVDPISGAESPVPFRGFVAKDFRPPELYKEEEYLATKVDAWCLGWSTFYLLSAQPLFQSAQDGADDPDWKLFDSGSISKLFQKKGWRTILSATAKDFILKLMDQDPKRRMSVKDALRHPWLANLASPFDGTEEYQEAAQSSGCSRATTGPDLESYSVVDSLDESGTATPGSNSRRGAASLGQAAQQGVAAAAPKPPTLLQRLHEPGHERVLPGRGSKPTQQAPVIGASRLAQRTAAAGGR